jgi:hypothetical protein
MSDLSLIPTDRLRRLEQIEKRYKLLTQKMSRQGVELAERGGFKIDKSPTQCLMRMDYWCTLEELEVSLDSKVY